MKNEHEFRRELAALINRHCAENDSNTPDFILADYLMSCLDLFDRISMRREDWYGVRLQPGCSTPASTLQEGPEVEG